MADDATLPCIASLATSITIFNKFEECSVLKLNLQKTEIIPIGKAQDNNINHPEPLK